MDTPGTGAEECRLKTGELPSFCFWLSVFVLRFLLCQSLLLSFPPLRSLILIPPTSTNPSAGVSSTSGARQFMAWDILDEKRHRRSQSCYICNTLFFLFHLTLNKLGPFHERGFAVSDTWSLFEKHELRGPHSQAFHLVQRKYEPFLPHNLSPVIFRSLTNLLLDSVAVGERWSEYLSRCEREAEVAFSWLWAQRRGLVFPAVSDCSRPAECKHDLMRGAALDTADTAQAISAHEVWGLAWPNVPLFCFSLPSNSHPLSQAPYSLPSAVWNWYFTTPSVCHKCS